MRPPSPNNASQNDNPPPSSLQSAKSLSVSPKPESTRKRRGLNPHRRRSSLQCDVECLNELAVKNMMDLASLATPENQNLRVFKYLKKFINKKLIYSINRGISFTFAADTENALLTATIRNATPFHGKIAAKKMIKLVDSRRKNLQDASKDTSFKGAILGAGKFAKG